MLLTMTVVAAIHAVPLAECELPVRGNEREREMEIPETQSCCFRDVQQGYILCFCIRLRDCKCTSPFYRESRWLRWNTHKHYVKGHVKAFFVQKHNHCRILTGGITHGQLIHLQPQHLLHQHLLAQTLSKLDRLLPLGYHPQWNNTPPVQFSSQKLATKPKHVVK